MNNIKKILVPVDFSMASENALDYVSGLVKKDEEIEVTLLHISSSEVSGSKKQELEEKLNTTINQRGVNIPSSGYQISSGKLIETILKVQASNSSDLIVMGTSGSSDDTETKTSDLVSQADCPVLVVPENSKEFAVNNIALALGPNTIDNSGGLQILHDIARTFGATVHVLTINRDGKSPSIENENQKVLEYYLESLLYFHAFPENSDIEIGISDYIKQKNIDMLAILPRNHTKNDQPSEGRLTKLLTLHAEIPLLTID